MIKIHHFSLIAVAMLLIFLCAYTMPSSPRPEQRFVHAVVATVSAISLIDQLTISHNTITRKEETLIPASGEQLLADILSLLADVRSATNKENIPATEKKYSPVEKELQRLEAGVGIAANVIGLGASLYSMVEYIRNDCHSGTATRVCINTLQIFARIQRLYQLAQ